MTTQPDLPIAVVGTTSSGKSTLLNLLCGRFLLAPKVQESPRVRVELRHRPRPNSATIHEPPELHSEPIHAHTDSSGRQTLQDMIQRLERLPLNRRLNAPIRIDLPIGLASGWTTLPMWVRNIAKRFTTSGTFAPQIRTQRRLILRDLPGLLNTESQETRQLISAGLNGALILLVINAGEVDHRKEEELMRLVFRNLRLQGKPWDQVFFALNRIDLFGSDPGQQDEKKHRISNIQHSLAVAAWEEYQMSQRPDPPTIHQIATLPAFAAQLLSSGGRHLDPNDRAFLLDQAVEYAGRMVPRDIADLLPRSRQRWKPGHVRTFCKHAATLSHWNDFRRALCRQIDEAADRDRRAADARNLWFLADAHGPGRRGRRPGLW